MLTHRLCLLVAAAPLLVSLASADDLTIVSKTGGPQGPGTSTMSMSASHFRIADGTNDVILDLAAGRIVTIDNSKKEYWEATLAEMNEAMQGAQAQMASALKQIPADKLALLPPAMREKLAAAGGGAPAALPAATVQKGTTPRRIAGYDCDQYVIAIGDQIRSEVWITQALQPPAAGYYDAMSARMAGNPMAQRFVKLFDELKKIRGVALAETTSFSMMGQKIESTREATEVKRGAIAAALFQIPAGLKRVDSPVKALAAAGGRK